MKKRFLRRFLYRLSRKIIRFFVCFCIIFSLMFSNLYNPMVVYAAGAVAPTALQIAMYLISATGAVDMFSNGGVRRVSGSAIDRCTQVISDALGQGVYTDTNGNYVFSEGVTQDFYEALLNDSSIDARAISNFSRFSTPYVNYQFTDAVNDCIHDLNSSNYLLIYGHNTDSNYVYTKCIIVDLSNVYYFVLSNDGNRFSLKTYNKNGNLMQCKYMTVYTNYNNYNGFSNVNKSSSTSNTNSFYIYISSNDNFNVGGNNFVFNPILSSYNFNSLWNNFPYFTDNGSLIWANRSLIICKTPADGNAMINKQSGTIVNNYFGEFPSVAPNVITNNNWDTIYNSYVTNVDNHVEEYYNSETGQFDDTALRQVMLQYGNNIIQAIEEGSTDIAERVNYLNDWMERIFDLLIEIRSLMEGGTGGSGGGSSSVDLSSIESYLQSIGLSLTTVNTRLNLIYSSLPNDSYQLQQIYTVLSNIYTALQNIGSGSGSGGGGGGSGGDWSKWFDILDELPEGALDEYVTPVDIILAILESSVPFCYVVGMVGIINAIGVQPVEPVFELPIIMNNAFINIDEDVEIDLTIFNDIRPIVIGFECLIFITGLMYLTIWLIKYILDILNA